MPESNSSAVDELLGRLTLEEKCAMVVGADAWAISGCDRLGIPMWRVSDGPVGVRGRNIGTGVVFPGPSAMAASWNVELVRSIGAALAEEATDRHVDVLLAPTVNLHRSPRGGRHFEMFSEDPELTARMAVAYITGVQAGGVAACIKHFVGNEQERERFTIDSHIDERTLHEAYLRPFEAAVQEADVRTVMAAYNYVNGEHACASSELLEGVLRDTWGFDGVVMSDWNAMKETVGPALNGVDLEMPGPGLWWGDGTLLAAVQRGDVPTEKIDEKVGRILRLLEWRGRLQAPSIDDEERPVDRDTHRALARRAAAEGSVLLRNSGVLPLKPGASVALLGPGAESLALLGGGSASLTPHPRPDLLETFSSRWAGDVTHAPGVHLSRRAETLPAEWIGTEGLRVEFFGNRDFSAEPFETVRRRAAYNVWWDDQYPKGHEAVSIRATLDVVPQESGPHRLVGSAYGSCRVFVDGVLRGDGNVDGFPAGLGMTATSVDLEFEEGVPVEVVLEAVQPDGNTYPAAIFDVGVARQDTAEGIEAAVAMAAAADIAVVVVGSNDEWESEGLDRATLDLPARQSELVARVAAANPNTIVVLNCGAPVLLPWLDDVAAALLVWYPGQEGVDAVVDLLIGEAEPAGRMPTTWAKRESDTPSYLHYPGESGVVRYGEELFLGHRWYDALGIEPLLPFGYGGSYTTFEWGEATLSGEETAWVVDVPITNVGGRRGSEVVQVYVSRPSSVVRNPVKVLAGFAKVELDPGETGRALVGLDRTAFRRWDVRLKDWVIDAGTYTVSVAASAVDVRSLVDVQIR